MCVCVGWEACTKKDIANTIPVLQNQTVGVKWALPSVAAAAAYLKEKYLGLFCASDFLRRQNIPIGISWESGQGLEGTT